MKKTLITMAVALAFSVAAQAAPIVQYDVNLGQNHLGPAAGWFTVTATVEAGTNEGLASYKITMTGWDNLYQYSPLADITDGLFGSGSIGFATLRSSNDSTPMTGAQPTVLNDPSLLTYGIGQTATALNVPGGWSITGSPTNNPFQVPVILLVGTYSGGTPAIAGGSDTRATVFVDDASVNVVEAEVGPIPEPATLALLALGGLVALRRRR